MRSSLRCLGSVLTWGMVHSPLCRVAHAQGRPGGRLTWAFAAFVATAELTPFGTEHAVRPPRLHPSLPGSCTGRFASTQASLGRRNRKVVQAPGRPCQPPLGEGGSRPPILGAALFPLTSET